MSPGIENMKGEHIIEAAKEIDAGRYLPSPSSIYDVVINDKVYPPKEILRLAYKIATGNEIGKISGGEPTNKYLRQLGFEIRTKKENRKEYSWVPVYKKIVEKLFSYEKNQPALVKIIREAGVTEGLKDKTASGEEALSEIDPFTFFACIHKVKNLEKRREVVHSVLEQLDIEDEVYDFDGIPTALGFTAWYFGYKVNRGDEEIPLLWDLCRQAVAGNVNEETYNSALSIATVKNAKLTSGLFIVNPELYLPINGQTIPFLETNGINTRYSSLAEYLKILKEVKEQFQQPYYKVSHRAYLENTRKIFWRIGTTDQERSYWQEMLNDNEVKVGWPELGNLGEISKINRDIIYDLLLQKGYTYKGSNSTVSRKAGEVWSFFKLIKQGDYVVAQDGHKILGIGTVEGDYRYDEDDVFPHKRTVKWIAVEKDFPSQSEGNLTTVQEIKDQLTKNELIHFLEEDKEDEIELENKNFAMVPLNQILYGPPGTGKTYNTFNHALKIIDGEKTVAEMEARGNRKGLTERFEELRKQGYVEFITFHQNYSYEEFVQGLRPKTESATQLIFEKRDGIFKRMTDEALKNLLESSAQEVVLEPTFDEVFDDFFKPLIEESGPITIQMETQGYQFRLTKYNEDLDNISFDKQSKTSHHAIYIPTLRKYFEQPGIEHTKGLKYYYKPLAKAMLKRAEQLRKVVKGVERKKYVLIIDEINRANISRVFGELITLLEEDKRWDNKHKMKLRLPSGDEFTVPKNMYIIGTMNTADKSIALLDVALRRRFDFIPMYPLADKVKKEYRDFFNALNESVYKERGSDFAIGHSYLMEDEADKTLDFPGAMNRKIIPLLNEYFYSARPGKVKEIIEAALKSGNIDNTYLVKADSLGILSIELRS